jgi:hypothetical protein
VLTKDLRTINGQPLVAALTPKIPGSSSVFGTLYGRYEIRFRSDRIPGYKIAWLLWPDQGTHITGSSSGVGGNGEIDFPEMGLDEDHVMGFVHHQDATVRDDQYWSKTPVDIRDWHTYTIEWSPNLVVFLLDGYEVGRTTERVPRTPMHWVIQTETQLTGGKPLASTRGQVEIDWVSMWGYDASTFAGVTPAPLSPAAYPVRVTAPASLSTVAGTIELQAEVLGDAYSQVHWYMRRDGAPFQLITKDDNGAPFSALWDTRTTPNGTIEIWANGRNSTNQWVSSRPIKLTINNK